MKHLLTLALLITFAAQAQLNHSLEEVELWKARWSDPLYTEEVGRINQAADDLFKNQTKVFYNNTKSPLSYNPGLTACAFRAMLFRNDVQIVKSYVLNQVRTPGSNSITSASPSSSDRGFQNSKFFFRILVAYDYLFDDFTASEQSEVENWLTDLAYIYRDQIIDRFSDMFPNRLDEDWSLKTGFANDPNAFKAGNITHTNSDGSPGNQIYFAHQYNNRKASIHGFIGMVGMLINDEVLKQFAKTYWMETIMFGIFPDGTGSDFQRNGDYGRPSTGLVYHATIVENLIRYADAMQRKGDRSLIDFKTSEGVFTSAGGEKSIEMMIGELYKILNGETTIYHKIVTANSKIDYVNEEDKILWLNDMWFQLANRHYDFHQYENILKRRSDNPDYKVASAGPLWYTYGGSGMTLPHYGFMWGDWKSTAPPCECPECGDCDPPDLPGLNPCPPGTKRDWVLIEERNGGEYSRETMCIYDDE